MLRLVCRDWAPARVDRILGLTLCLGCAAGGGVAEPDEGAPLDAQVDRDGARRRDAGGAQCDLPEVDSPALGDPLRIEGDPGAQFGWFDPSLVRTDEGIDLLSYSVVDGTIGGERLVHPRIAVSDDRGDRWRFVSDVAGNPPVEIDCGSRRCSGRWNYEVSSLTFDRSRPAPRRYALYVHAYFIDASGEQYARGFIGRFVAATPAGRWSGPEKVIGWPSDSSISSEGAATLVTDIEGLGDCLALTEPSALSHGDGRVDLAVGCVFDRRRIRIERLTSADGGASWLRVGTMLGPRDAEHWGFSESVNAAELFAVAGTEYVAASPRGHIDAGFEGYRGCYVVELLPNGLPVRCADGRAKVVRVLDVGAGRFNGACAYVPGTPGGYLQSVLRLDLGVRPFRIYAGSVAAP